MPVMYCDCFHQSSRFEYPQDFPVTASVWDLCPHWENYIHSLSSLFGIHYSSLLSSEAVQLCNKKGGKKKSGSLCLDWGINCPSLLLQNTWPYLIIFFLPLSLPFCKPRNTFSPKLCSLAPRLTYAGSRQQWNISTSTEWVATEIYTFICGYSFLF